MQGRVHRSLFENFDRRSLIVDVPRHRPDSALTLARLRAPNTRPARAKAALLISSKTSHDHLLAFAKDNRAQSLIPRSALIADGNLISPGCCLSPP